MVDAANDWRSIRHPKATGTEAFDGRMPAQCLPAPPGDLADYCSLAEVGRLICSKPGGRSDARTVQVFLSRHEIPVQRIASSRALVRRDLVLAALGKQTSPAEPTAEFEAVEWICLADATKLLWGGKATMRRKHLTRKLLATHGIAVFRPRGNLTLVPRQAVLALVRELKAVKRLPVPREKRRATPAQRAALEIGQRMPKAGRVLPKRAASIKEAAARFALEQAHTAPTVRPAAEPAPVNFTREPEIRHRDARDLPFSTRRKSAL